MSDPNPIEIYRKRTSLTLAAFAAKFRVNKTTAMRWEKGRVPPKRVLEVEKATGISRHSLRPDLYPRSRKVMEAAQ